MGLIFDSIARVRTTGSVNRVAISFSLPTARKSRERRYLEQVVPGEYSGVKVSRKLGLGLLAGR